MNKLTDQQASPVFGLRYLEDREVEGLDVVGCRAIGGAGATSRRPVATTSTSTPASVAP